jgi:hypothetical protein
MVAKVISGKDIQGALNYNEHKVKTGVAKCIMANRFPGDLQDMNFSEKLDRLLYFTDKNCTTNKNRGRLNPIEYFVNQMLRILQRQLFWYMLPKRNNAK